MENIITLGHGDGGSLTNQLIEDVFYNNFYNEILENSLDSAALNVNEGRLAFTTDSFVVKPLFFRGGDIGKLCVCGTINDLTAGGAKSLYLSCSFIIEEGFSIEMLKKIAASMGETCKKAKVKIVTGDTKVVEKGFVDGVYINTSGIGIISGNFSQIKIEENDKIILTGGIAEHGTTIAVERYNLDVGDSIKSDCMPLNFIIERLDNYLKSIKLMKDPTRGGLATALNEISQKSKMGIIVSEEEIPIKKEIKSINDMLGLDALYMACEGRMIIVTEEKMSLEILNEIKCLPGCEDAAIIGSFSKNIKSNKVLMETEIGGKRLIDSLNGTMLPRIC